MPPRDSRVPAVHLCPVLPRALGLDPRFPHQRLPAAPGAPALQRRPGLDRRRQPARCKDPRPTPTALASGHPASSQCPQGPPGCSSLVPASLSAHPGCPIPIPLSPGLGVPTPFLPWQIPHPSCHWTDRSPWNYSQWVPGHPLPGHRFCTALCTNSQWGLLGGVPAHDGGRVLRGSGWGGATGGLV